jgi:hypothetical protein
MGEERRWGGDRNLKQLKAGAYIRAVWAISKVGGDIMGYRVDVAGKYNPATTPPNSTRSTTTRMNELKRGKRGERNTRTSLMCSLTQSKYPSQLSRQMLLLSGMNRPFCDARVGGERDARVFSVSGGEGVRRVGDHHTASGNQISREVESFFVFFSEEDERGREGGLGEGACVLCALTLTYHEIERHGDFTGGVCLCRSYGGCAGEKCGSET